MSVMPLEVADKIDALNQAIREFHGCWPGDCRECGQAMQSIESWYFDQVLTWGPPRRTYILDDRERDQFLAMLNRPPSVKPNLRSLGERGSVLPPGSVGNDG